MTSDPNALVASLMTRDPHTMPPETSLLEAISFMDRTRLRHVLVTRGPKLVGVVSDRDTKRDRPTMLSEEGRKEWRNATTNTPLSMVMSRDVITVPPTATIRDAVQKFIEHRIGCIPVVEGEILVGVITYHDLLGKLLELLP